MPSANDVLKLRAKIDEASRQYRQPLASYDVEEMLVTASEICDANSLAEALDYIDGMYSASLEAHRWCRRMAYQQLEDNMRDLAIRIDALNVGAEAADRAAYRAAQPNRPDSHTIDQACIRHSGTVIDFAARFQIDYPALQIPLDDYSCFYGPQWRLAPQALKILNDHVSPGFVLEWTRIALFPGTADPHYVLMPLLVTGFELKLGPEITRDWLVRREGHGFPISDIAKAWKSVKQYPDFIKPEVGANGNLVFHLNKKRLVTNSARDTLITYFDTDYGT